LLRRVRRKEAVFPAGTVLAARAALALPSEAESENSILTVDGVAQRLALTAITSLDLAAASLPNMTSRSLSAARRIST
jgi:hypothetical protein